MKSVQQSKCCACPLCRKPFPASLELQPNTELRDLIVLASKLLLDEQVRAAVMPQCQATMQCAEV